MKPLRRTWLMGLCAVTVVASLLLITPSFARYRNTASTAVTYGRTDTLFGQTLSADTEMYDFGVYDHGVDTSEFAHTVRIRHSAPLSGVLRFSWDDTTRANKDIAVYIDSCYYTAVQNSGYTDYTVAALDGDLQIPFSLIFASPVARVAVLDVSWYPDESDEPTLFSRYLLTVSGGNVTSAIPTFVEENTVFLTNRLLQVEVSIPAHYAGVLMTPADNTFSAGIRYYNDVCPNGATLLRDSALFVPRQGDSTRLYVDLSAHLSNNTPVSLRVGVSDIWCDTLSCTPLANTEAFTVSLNNDVGIVTATEPLVITLTQPVAMRDSDWSHTGNTPADVTWQILRREGSALQPVKVGQSLTVTVSQSANGAMLTLAAPHGTQSAGTYVLVLTQYYYGYPVLEIPVWFFIDYR